MDRRIASLKARECRASHHCRSRKRRAATHGLDDVIIAIRMAADHDFFQPGLLGYICEAGVEGKPGGLAARRAFTLREAIHGLFTMSWMGPQCLTN